jgi:hypothetical protein
MQTIHDGILRSGQMIKLGAVIEAKGFINRFCCKKTNSCPRRESYFCFLLFNGVTPVSKPLESR